MNPPSSGDAFEVNRPPLSPNLAYEAASPSDGSPPTISAFVAEAVVYLSNSSTVPADQPRPPTPPPYRETSPVFDALVGLLDTMTASRFTRIHGGSSGDPELTNSSAGTEDLGNSLLDDFDLAFQMPNPEYVSPYNDAILSDGSLVHFHGCANAKEPDPEPAPIDIDDNNGLWRKLISFIPSAARSSYDGERAEAVTLDCAEYWLGAAKTLSCKPISFVAREDQRQIGPINGLVSVQGYKWANVGQYKADKARRARHFRQQLMSTRQFLERRSVPRLRRAPTANLNDKYADEDFRRKKRRIWLQLYKVTPAPRHLYSLKSFHQKPAPVYDHFQLKNLLCMRADTEVFYLSHEEHGGRYYTCVMAYNLQSGANARVLGPWSFNRARPLSNTSRPIYHSLSSISFESRYLFSLAVSKNYVATSDTSSSILLSRLRSWDRDATSSSSQAGGAHLPYGGGVAADTNDLPIAGHALVCQRVSAQPLQIINSVQLIEDPVHQEGGCGDLNTGSGDDYLIKLIMKQAEDKSLRVLAAACDSLDSLLENVTNRVALGVAWLQLSPDAGHSRRSLRRLRTLFTSTTAALVRNISGLTPEGRESTDSAAEDEVSFVPTPASLIVLTAGNDKSLCEYSLVTELCRESTHIMLSNGDTICKIRSGAINGFSACSGQHKARVKSLLKLTRSWSYPFCINRIAMHPNNNLMLLVGDSPSVVLTARNVPDTSNPPRLGTLKNSLYTLDFHQDASFAAAWHPNGIMFATGSDDRTIAVWDVRQLLAPVCVLATEVTACRKLEFSPDGRYLLSCESEDAVVIYSVPDGFEYAQKIPFFGGCTGATFSSDSKRVIIGIGHPGGLMELVISMLPYSAVHSNDKLNI